MPLSDTLKATLAQAKADKKILPEAYRNLMSYLRARWMPAWVHASIAELIEAGHFEELNDRFYKLNEFGTAGIRGRTIGKITPAAEAGTRDSLGAPQYAAAGTAIMNDFNVIRATIGLYRYADTYLKASSHHFEAPKLIIAHDVRHFSRHFAELAASTWAALGGRSLLFSGPRSTPQLSFSVRYTASTCGVVITASHNPAHDNGYKVYFRDGSQIVAPHDKGIIDEVNKVELKQLKPFLKKDLSKIVILPPEVDEAYLKALEATLIDPEILRTHPPKLVYSPVHGTGSVSIIPALERFGASPTLVEEQMAFDGRFPTVKSPNPQNPEALSLAMKKAESCGINVVIATDPDDDRMGAALRQADGSWLTLSGNTIGSLLAEDRLNAMKAKGQLPPTGHPNAVLIKTFVTTPLQEAIATSHGIACINTLTGFKWIGNKLALYEDKLKAKLYSEGLSIDYDNLSPAKKRELLLQYSRFYVFGGEESYGYLGCDSVRDKDGNAATLMLAELLARRAAKGQGLKEALDELYLKYGAYAETALSLTFEGASGALKIKKLLTSYAKNPPKTMGDFVVRSMRDFSKETILDLDNQEIPKSTVLFFELDDGTSFALRPSGTEPNVRFYCFTKEAVREPADLADAQKRANARLEELKTILKADAEARAGS